MTDKPNNSILFSRVLLHESNIQGIDVNPIKLQRLLYITYGWACEMGNSILLSSIEFKAYKFGPRNDLSYEFFKSSGINPIKSDLIIKELDLFKSCEISLMSEVVSVYANLSLSKLTKILTKEDTAWFKTWNNGDGAGNFIPKDLVLYDFLAIRRKLEG